MSSFNKNLHALTQNHPNIARRLLELTEQAVIQVSTEPNAIVVTDEQENVTRFDKTINFSLETVPKLIVLMGLGDTGLLKQALDLNGEQDVLVYEPQIEYLKGLLEVKDISDILSHPKLHLIVGHDPLETSVFLLDFFAKELSRLMVPGMLSFVTPLTDKISQNKKHYDLFTQNFADLSQKCQNLLNPNDEDDYRGLINSAMNFPEYFAWPHMKDLKDIHKGMPGVVVATGPSLSQSLDLLKANQDKCVIFCCDSALTVLLKHGIKPDYVSSLERTGQVAFMFEDLDVPKDVHLVAPGVLVPEVFKNFNGSQICLDRNIGFENWFTGGITAEQKLEIGVSASHLCMLGLRHFGCETILLLGQDCAYDPNTGRSHDANAHQFVLEYGELEKTEHDYVTKTTVLGFGGRQQTTTQYLQLFANVYTELVIKYGLTHVYNLIPQEYGIPLERIERLDPNVGFEQFLTQTLDKQSVHNKIAKQARPSVSDVLAEGKSFVSSTQNTLSTLTQDLLKLMQSISLFGLRYDLNYKNRGHQEKYLAFIKEIHSERNKIINGYNGFFETHFKSMVQTSHYRTELELYRIPQQGLNPNNAIMKETLVIYDWCKSMHSWGSRALALLESQNTERWNF